MRKREGSAYKIAAKTRRRMKACSLFVLEGLDVEAQRGANLVDVLAIESL